MPWKIEKRSSEFCVINQNSGENEGCHATRTEANDQMAALYASEGKKEVLMDKHYGEPVKGETTYQPLGGATSFSELAAYREASEAANNVRDLTWQFQDMVTNIMTDKEIEDKRAAITSLADEFSGLVEAESKKSEGKSFWMKVKEAILGKPKEAEASQETTEEPASEKDVNKFMVWKEGDTWRWLAVYSNKFRDQDEPPEILSEAAHKGFVQAVDDGEWNYPEMWLWHVPGTKCGYCDFVAYDDQGFAIASGVVEDEGVAKNLAADDDLKVSHGMPSMEIERDPDDSTIIVRYRTREISPLPSRAAANKLTSFSVGGTMAFPKDKREFLLEMFSGDEDRVVALEQELGTKAKEAAEEGMEYKENDTEAPVEQEAKAAEEATPEAEKEEVVEEASPAEEPVYVTRDELVEEVGGLFAEFGESLQALQESVAAIGKELKELQRSEEDRIAEKAELAPAASLHDMLRSRAVGSKEARVDGRTSEAKVGPKQATPFDADGPTPSTFLNAMMATSQTQLQQ